VHPVRWLAAVVAVSVALALTLIAPAGATSQPPRVEHCHWWPHTTKVHWEVSWLHENYGFAARVVDVVFNWTNALGPGGPVRRDGDNAEAQTPIGATAVVASLVVDAGTFGVGLATKSEPCVFHL